MLAKRADRGFCSSPGNQSLRQNWWFFKPFLVYVCNADFLCFTPVWMDVTKVQMYFCLDTAPGGKMWLQAIWCRVYLLLACCWLVTDFVDCWLLTLVTNTLECILVLVLHQNTRQAALERQDLCCTDLAHHEPESVNFFIIITRKYPRSQRLLQTI